VFAGGQQMSEKKFSSSQNEELLRELALRLATVPGDPRVMNPQLFVGELPQRLSEEIPLPENSHVLGSLARNPQQLEIVLDSELKPEAVTAFYKERLSTLGWSELDWPPRAMRGGFTATAVLGLENSVQFCRGTRGPGLRIMALPGKEGGTDVRLSLDMGESSPCAQQAHMRKMQGMAMGAVTRAFLPKLVPPEGAQQTVRGMSFNVDEASSSASVQTDIGMEMLVRHYTAQLEKAGWTRTNEGESGPVAWNSWSVEDEEHEQWQGLFLLLKRQDVENQYFLHVRADSSRTGGGFLSFAPMHF
jgi:hypothetical protein